MKIKEDYIVIPKKDKEYWKQQKLFYRNRCCNDYEVFLIVRINRKITRAYIKKIWNTFNPWDFKTI